MTASTNIGAIPVSIEQISEISDNQPKKKRGRPPKNPSGSTLNSPAPTLATEEDIQLMAEVEADCPYQKDDVGQYGIAGTGWCNDEFAKRKQEQITKSKKSEDKEFLKEAKSSDTKIDKALTRGSESFFEAVKELINSGDKGYYKALGFKSFNSYRESKSQYSRSHIGAGIQAYKALHAHIPDDKLVTIPIPTAILLTKLPESKLTPEVIEAAVTMKIQDFKEQEFPKHASLLVDGTTGQPIPVQPEEFDWIARMRVHKDVADMWKKFMAIARWKATGLQADNDVFQNYDLTEKALLAIYYECCKASGWETEYEESQHQTTDASEEPAF